MPNRNDGTPLLKIIRFHHNWRDLSGSGLRVPRAPDDQLLKGGYLASRNPKDADYLRPGTGSPLATGGAGNDLPRYVGALPPAGVAPWDWERTWKVRAGNPADKEAGAK